MLFSESFDDADLLKQGWYRGSTFAFFPNVTYGEGICVEYRWKDQATKPRASLHAAGDGLR